ncbi:MULTISPECIES: ABC transporter ATP-binding protein [unclassified Gemella]|uniref:ABC transporter ATP-binding protein n=1 Tax=unclassified Gemella TaxID=2624949 RepID=UPI0015D0AEB7|nr:MULTISPECIES: ABC transporter ATP-binding protein [unclassified Gemella]MBF0710315.1 ABC transporter ATP-binding protein [Gemella sp. GL1.1]NYS27659.1 ABC transporter ATP-binding protein [Gemella sp. GL1]
MTKEVKNVASAKRQWQVFKRLVGYGDKYKFLLVLALLFLFVTTIIQAIIPRIAKYFIDTYIHPDSYNVSSTVIYILLAYYGLYLLQAIFTYLGKITFSKVSFGIVRDLRNEAFSKIQKLSMSYFDKTAAGSIVSRLTNDTEAIANMFGVIFSSFISGTFLIFVSLYSVFSLNYNLGLFLSALMPLVFACMYYYRKLSVGAMSATRSKLSEINSKLAESIDGMRIIQSFNQEKRLTEDFEKINSDHTNYYIKYLKVDSLLLRPALALLKMIAYAILLLYFGFQGEYLGLTAGTMYAFIQYTNRLFDPMIELTQSFSAMQTSVVSAERVFELIDENSYEPKQNNKDIKINEGNIEFKNVSFSYDGKRDILKDISFKVNKGETIAFVGHTGSGKSSIINLFMRFYDFDRGQILIDGQDIKDYKREELLSKIGLVLQDPFLYHGDIESNIRLFSKNISDEDIVEAAKFVDAHDFISRLDGAYKAKVTERGSTYSTGQRQLITFARTIAHNPKILILDEATANIDSETEDLIQASLSKMRKGRTTIAIAHRLSTIQDANCIYVLDKGRIIESGSHEDLLALEGTYYKMYLLQTGNK